MEKNLASGETSIKGLPQSGEQGGHMYVMNPSCQGHVEPCRCQYSKTGQVH